MLKTNLAKIDRFFPIILGTSVLIALMVFLVLRVIFSAINRSNHIEPELLESTEARVSKQNLDKAIEAIEKREFVPLDLR